jgi:hypothetical protein
MDDYKVRYLTDDYQTAEEIVRTNYCGGNFGFNECWHNQGWEQFGFGLYKMTISDIYSEERTYFYLDMRYCEGQIDCTIMFDHSQDIASIKSGVTTCNFNGFTDIPTGSIVKIWEVQGYGTPTTDCLPYFWENCLVMTTRTNNP